MQARSPPESRIIVFATYRDTVQTLVDAFSECGIACERFVGQASRDAERGLTQKEQIEILSRFRSGEFRCLIATSVGEEGLDVPSTDMVIFYEAVPSEIRSIQRKGRTGRSGSGTIVVLVTKGPSDETFRYVSQTRERAMVQGSGAWRHITSPAAYRRERTGVWSWLPASSGGWGAGRNRPRAPASPSTSRTSSWVPCACELRASITTTPWDR